MTNVDERRRSRRNRTLKDGKVVFNAGMSLIDCTIRDRTEGGARLQLTIPVKLPKVFELLCVTEGLLYPATIVWHRGDHVGITFTGMPKRLPRGIKTKQQLLEVCG